ncbi:hypothetical protein QR680_013686 [Steinernema hermaphroditum]|uniref:Riboflavin transporter n=1 Tax=Steinernema hermaphroditum TaxID=289476 RepID=A0AA39I6C4_9BILA|nr:hypothetical protein QR680_013686 [Steinernema hermaphroditum]
MISVDFATVRRHLFVAVYGMGSWLSINAMYVELPLLVDKIPEGWNFPSYMVVVLQIMCFLSLLYSIVAYKFESLIEGNVYMISAMCLMSVTGILMSAFVYNIKSSIFGGEHSALLLTAIGIMGLPCTVSDMLFMPYISKFKESHIVATYFIGMGLSAMVPSGISFAQTVPYKKNVTSTSVNGSSFTSEVLVEGPFDVTVFMCLMALVMSISLCGFLLLVRDRKVNAVLDIEPVKDKFGAEDTVSGASVAFATETRPRLSVYENAFLLLLSLFLGGAQNSAYHLANSLFIMANPIFCFIPFVVSIRSHLFFVLHTIACTLCLAFFVTLGVVDIFGDHSLAEILICIVAPLTSGLMSWERAAIAEVLRNDSHEKGLFWCGTFTQIGAFVAAILMFLLTNVFHAYP